MIMAGIAYTQETMQVPEIAIEPEQEWV